MATPAVAYSTRKLRTAYSGACLRVRRSSDSTEQDIGFSGGKLDTAALLSFVGAGDGFVTTWYDQSGNGRDATQATAAKQMYVVQAGATVAFGAQGDVAILNPAENRFLGYTLASLIAPPYSSLFVARLIVSAGGVAWNTGNAVYWQLSDGAATKWFDGTGAQPQVTPNTNARAFAAMLATGDKRMRSSAGLTTTAGTAPSNIGTTGHFVGTYADGYATPQNASYHTCAIWSGSIDVDATYTAAAAWL